MKKMMYSRENEVKTILEIIKNKEDYMENNDNCLIILLNGSWGSGKTTFISELCSAVQKNEDMELLNNYNAYEHDFYDNAFIPFFASIDNIIKLKDEQKKTISSVFTGFVNGAMITSYAAIKSMVANKTGFNLDDIKDNMLKLEEEIHNSDYVVDYQKLLNIKSSIKDSITQLSKDKTQIIIIDELDRCKPTFAMDTLELIKHFFDINNCVFIISVDKLQLEESIKSVYGNGLDGEKYFSKLFDYQFDLPLINFSDAVDTTNIPNKSHILSFANNLFKILNVSLRDSKKIFNDLLHKCKKDWTYDQLRFILIMITLKYTDLLFFNAIINGDFDKYKKNIMEPSGALHLRYMNFLNFSFYKNKKLSFIFGELTLALNINYCSLGNEYKNHLASIDSIPVKINDLQNDVIEFVPFVDDDLSVKENIVKIVS